MGNAAVILQNFILELDGKPVGRIGSVAIGGLKADVVTQNSTHGGFADKRLTRQTLDSTSFSCGAGMSQVFYDWLSNAFNRSYARKNGAIVAIDSNRKEVSRMDFQNALIESIVLPKLDSASKGSASITVKFKPESVRYGKGGGDANVGSYASPHSRIWNTSTFALSINGLEKECAAITDISALGIGQGIAVHVAGESDRPVFESTSSVYPSIVINLPLSSVGGFDDWFKSVATGQAASGKTGTLKYLGPGSKTEFFSLEFSDLGISEKALDRGADRTSDRPVTISLYYDSVTFKANASAIM
ncbi:MAG TPA: phage tail protein [Pyrinomonadaceae bacterium]